MTPEILFATGIPMDSEGGTGRFLRALAGQAENVPDIRANFISPGKAAHRLDAENAWLADLDQEAQIEPLAAKENLVVCHPQGLGLSWALKLMQARQHSWYFTLDSGFFCLRSYNHLDEEMSACLRCVGGRFDNIEKHGCRAFPYPQAEHLPFLEGLLALAKAGRVSFLAQNARQHDLLKQHFGAGVRVETVGLCADYDYHPERGPKHRLVERYDIVMHSYHLPAKGMHWAVELAHQMPEKSFLFPFAAGFVAAERRAPNMHFIPMTWETGLHDAVMKADFTLCPSLWSAPVEGAVVKSIMWSRACVVVDEPTTFASELPDTVVVRVPTSPAEAAAILRERMHSDPHRAERAAWLDAFLTDQTQTFSRVAAAVLSASG